ncbi:MAG: hypothetical protein CM1200mP20_09410 [Pseudomonadota bacterium]|nr:MAG: hypothetical protein CM1200mP20_09410 [Pseudomonadota bacterium]
MREFYRIRTAASEKPGDAYEMVSQIFQEIIATVRELRARTQVSLRLSRTVSR